MLGLFRFYGNASCSKSSISDDAANSTGVVQIGPLCNVRFLAAHHNQEIANKAILEPIPIDTPK
jgi:hypothetical protein